MLFLSILPNVLYQELTGKSGEWLFIAKIALLTLLLWVTFFWAPAHKLRDFFLVFTALYLVEESFFRLGLWDQWQVWFSRQDFVANMLGSQLLRLGTGLAMLAAMLGLGFKRRDFFFSRGQLDAPSSRMPIFGFSEASTWKRLGAALTLYIGLSMLAMLWIFSRPGLPAFQAIGPLLPWILLFAATNAFGEEMLYRSALLAPTHKVLGGEQAILLTATFFGIGHYYGVPYGITGVLLAGFFGWVLGRAMLETRGFFWPWMIHMATDVVIFSFLAMGAVTAGGL
jgi:membrane protease YdiL (CAAX protease family)